MKLCFGGNLEMLRYFLVELKADLTILDLKDESCLFSAVKGNHPQVIELILQHNKDSTFVDHECSRNG